MDTTKIKNRGNALIVAHRGCSALERENTCSAFVAAGNRSYFGIETDVRNTVDGKFVLLHDNDTTRCGIDFVEPEKCTLATIQSVVLKDKDEKRGRTDLRVPEMIDYIRICKRYDKVGVLEFKGAYNEEQMGRLVAEIEAEYSLEKMIFISFSFENLLVLRKLRPDTHVQYLVGAFETEEKFDECVATLREHKMDIDIWSRALTEERVKKLLDNGIEVNSWTVDDPEEAERLISWGVQFITSNGLE